MLEDKLRPHLAETRAHQPEFHTDGRYSAAENPQLHTYCFIHLSRYSLHHLDMWYLL